MVSRTVDRDVTAEVTAAKGAVKKGAKVTKSLFPGSTLEGNQ